MTTLDERFPLLGIEQDCILSKMGEVTVAFELALPEIFTLSTEEYNAFHQAWLKAIRLLPKGTVLHKQDWFVRTGYAPDFTRDDTSLLSRSSDRYFHERPFLDHDCHIFLTKKPAGRKAATSLTNLLTKKKYSDERSHEAIGCAGVH